ncbi:MAG: metallopeptidase family protein [Phycisphaerae bacterium]|nr:metallopeptidase family protein [Phycisphaerae bacterium]
MRFDADTFARLIEEAVQLLPEQFRRHMENVTIDVQPLADRETCRDMGLKSPYQLLGLYRGVPLTERHVEMPPAFPDCIEIYQKAIEAVCDDEGEAIEEIRTTVLHEVAHFFGFNDDQLEEMGYG